MPVPLVAGVVAVGTIILGGMVSSSCRPLFNMMSQQLFKLFPNELIPPINLISMRYRGLITEDHYYKECQLGGISRDRAELLYHESEQRLNAYDVIGLWRRGGIDENTRNERIMQAGWTEDRIPHLVNLTRQIPSASDVIAFAVREVYSPEIAEEFGQYEGGDRVFESTTDRLDHELGFRDFVLDIQKVFTTNSPIETREDILEKLRILIAAYRSANEGNRPVSLGEVGDYRLPTVRIEKWDVY